MFLECVKSGNITYLYKSFYLTVAKGKYKRTRELIGTLDELSKIYDDPIEHFKKVLKEETLLEKQQKKNNIINLSINSSLFNSNDIINGTVIDDKINKNFGSVILQFIYHKLDFEKLVKRIKYRENAKINISKLMQLLILCKCIYPDSNSSDFENQSKFADTFILSEDDIYKGLKILNKYREEIINHFNDYSQSIKINCKSKDSLINLLSMAFLKLLKSDLNNEYSIKEIQKELNEFNMIKIRNSNFYQISHYGVLIAKIQKLYSIEINRTVYSGKDIINVIGDVKRATH